MFTDFVPNETKVVYKYDPEGVTGIVREVFTEYDVEMLSVEWNDGFTETVSTNEVIAV